MDAIGGGSFFETSYFVGAILGFVVGFHFSLQGLDALV